MIRSTLRTVKSLPSLKTARASPGNAPPLPSREASSLLSQPFVPRDFRLLTVEQLKRELKSRGLPCSGTKGTLISRITQADATQTRNYASSSTTTSSPSATTVVAPASIPIHAPATEALPASLETPSKTESPGLPENPFEGSKKVFDIKLPKMRPEGEPELQAKIPTLADNFRTPEPQPTPEVAPLKVINSSGAPISHTKEDGALPEAAKEVAAATEGGFWEWLKRSPEPLEEQDVKGQSVNTGGLLAAVGILAVGWWAGGEKKQKKKASLAQH